MLSVLLILIFIRPFISSLAFPYENFLYSQALLGFLAIWIITKKISLSVKPGIKYALWLFVLALSASIVFSQDRLTSLQGLYQYTCGILLFIVVISLSPAHKDKIIRCILIAGVAISVLAIYQYFFGFPRLLAYINKQGASDSFALDYITRKRPFFPFVTPNTLAGYLIMLIPLALSYKNRIWLILPLFLALLLTKSMGALLSLFIALAIYLYLKGNPKKTGVFFLAGIIIIMGYVFITRVALQKIHAQPMFSAVMRLNYWRETWEIIKRHPLVGVGLGNFNLAYSRYAHNSYLQIWAEIGILGVVSILWLAVSGLKSSWKALKDHTDKAQLIGLITANIAFLIHNLVDFTFFLPEVSLLWWAILAIAII